MIISNVEYNQIGYKETDTEKKEDEEIKESVSIFNDEDEDEGIKLIAHRGASNEAPENTIPAFEKAAEKGYNTVECDISWTKDNVAVILHDNTINRTARNSWGFKFIFKKKCSEMNYEQLEKYDFGSWFSSDYKDTKIPTFDDLIECSKDNDLNLYVEIKENSDFDEEKAKILIEKAEESGIEDRITWISFDENYLEIIKELVPEARLGYLSRYKVTDNTIDILDELKTEDNEVFLNIKSCAITKEGSELLDKSGYEYEAWTVDSKEELEYLSDLNCNGITTNELTKEEVEEVFKNKE